MNIHKNARLTLARGIEVVGTIINQGLTRAAAARMAGVCEATVRKWLGRYLAKGEAGLDDRSSRPKHSPARDGGRNGVGDRQSATSPPDACAHCCEPGPVEEHGGMLATE